MHLLNSLDGAPIAGAIALCLTAGGLAAQVTVPGDPADYEAQSQMTMGSPATVAAAGGTAEELRVFSRDTDGFLYEEGRAIFQFDLSTLESPVASAEFNVELLSVEANNAYSVEVWGVDSNRSGPTTAGDAGAAGEFGASSYEPAYTDSAALADEGTPSGRVSQDITVYLNERYDEMADGGASWVYLRLQPGSDYDLGSGIDSELTFASANHSDPDLRPHLNVVPVPEPRYFSFLMAGAAAALVFCYRRGRRR